jgi:hypothetical protein
MIQPLDGQLAGIRLHFDVAVAQRVACQLVTDDFCGMDHSEWEKKIGELASGGHSIQIANEDVHEMEFKMAY